MEYIRPHAPSFFQRVKIFLLDLIFVCACIRRFIDDHCLSPSSPTPRPIKLPKDHIPIYQRVSSGTTADQQRKEDLASNIECEASTQTKSSTSSSPAAADSSTTSTTTNSLPYQLRVLSLNIWGLPISPRTDLRAFELSKSFHLFDLIAFQELSHEREVKFLRDRAREAGLIYAHQFTHGVGFPIWHGVTAPGLVVFSRFPILDIHFKRYSINGKMYQLDHADYMLAKGVGLVRVDVSELAYPNIPNGACRPVVGVDIFLTHLHANYTSFFYDWRKWMPMMSELEARLRAGENTSQLASLMPIPLLKDISDEYLAHRVLQSYECARFIAAFRRDDFLTLLCGDLNCPPHDLCMQIIQSLTFGQSSGSVPRFIDSFHEMHPESNGYTCGAKDNSFTFSTEPIVMERRAMNQVQEEEVTSAIPSKKIRHMKSFSGSNSPQSPDSPDPIERSLLRAQWNNSPLTDPALIPVDASLPRTTHGEHVTLLPSSSPTLTTSHTPSATAASPSSTAIQPKKLSPLAWVMDDTPMRIDYVLYANPVARMKCSCQWALMQLPFQSLTEEDQLTTQSTCTCDASILPQPSHTWKVVAASVFKQYMMEPNGKMTSISDHHGISVTFQFNPDQTLLTSPYQPKQPTSTIIITQLPAKPDDSSTSTESFSVSGSPKLPLKKRLLTGLIEEDELFTLDEKSISKTTASTPSHAKLEKAQANAAATLSPSSSAAVPILSTPSILLLSEGVLWFGLRDASDRRSAHLVRMLHAFLIFIIGSRTMWMYILNRYFESLMIDLLPHAFMEYPWPTGLVTFLKIALFIIDWAHTFLPIYIVLEWLLTTFPAKEEQMTMRQTIAEMTRLREFQQNQQARRETTNKKQPTRSQPSQAIEFGPEDDTQTKLTHRTSSTAASIKP